MRSNRLKKTQKKFEYTLYTMTRTTTEGTLYIGQLEHINKFLSWVLCKTLTDASFHIVI